MHQLPADCRSFLRPSANPTISDRSNLLLEHSIKLEEGKLVLRHWEHQYQAGAEIERSVLYCNRRLKVRDRKGEDRHQ